jgi:hypothetical protein
MMWGRPGVAVHESGGVPGLCVLSHRLKGKRVVV